TGTPPSKRKVEPPLVALTGRLATLPLMALLMKEMSVPFSDRAAGMKWSACNAVAESDPAVPPRNSGSWPAVKMKSSEILSRRPCAWSDAAASVSPTRHDQQRRINPLWDRENGPAGDEETLRGGSRQAIGLPSSLEMSWPDRTTILDARALSRALQRMAVEVLELARGTDRLVLIGIQRRGVELAERIAKLIEKDEGVVLPRGALDITLYRDDLETVGPKPVIGETRIPGDLAGKHVVIVDDVLYTGRTVRAALDELADFGRPERPSKKVPALRGKTIVNLFCEASTRTRISFEFAEKRLSADTVNVAASGSAVQKGETLVDTARNLEAMRIDMVVIRHPSSGAAEFLGNRIRSNVVSAGDGKHEHPTQALLDLLTIRDKYGKIAGLKVCLV